MYLYELPDIKNSINVITADEEYSLNDLHKVISDFFDNVGKDMRKNIGEMIAEELEFAGDGEKLLSYLYEMFASTVLSDAKKRSVITPIVNAIAEFSDVEDYCENKIYVVIKGMDIVKEYDSWDEAEHDVDEWYIGCCDDAYIAENVLFQVLCYVQSREYDTLMNYCSVVEFDATDIENGREYWENENC